MLRSLFSRCCSSMQAGNDEQRCEQRACRPAERAAAEARGPRSLAAPAAAPRYLASTCGVFCGRRHSAERRARAPLQRRRGLRADAERRLERRGRTSRHDCPAKSGDHRLIITHEWTRSRLARTSVRQSPYSRRLLAHVRSGKSVYRRVKRKNYGHPPAQTLGGACITPGADTRRDSRDDPDSGKVGFYRRTQFPNQV
jgi:hypothetical protein